jgi:hypothetical protein
MVEKKKSDKNYSARSSTNMALTTRLFGVLLTVFILILTVKSELLQYKIITLQLVLAIPITFISMVINSKIHNEKSFFKYRTLNIITASFSISLILNALGLLITKYVSVYAGILFFIVLIIAYGLFFIIDYKDRKVFNEMIIIIMLFIFGLLPSLVPSIGFIG